MGEPKYRIRAGHDGTTVTVYQAYAPHLGLPTARDGRFPAAWKRERMTWIEPSFLWMMYRCGWGEKPQQETVLALDITREGFEWALRHACLSHFDADVHADRDAWRSEMRRAPVRVVGVPPMAGGLWGRDPERDLHLRPLSHRSLQLGLSGEAAGRFADEWITAVRDVTPLAREVHALVRDGDLDGAARRLPHEPPYAVPDGLLDHLRP